MTVSTTDNDKLQQDVLTAMAGALVILKECGLDLHQWEVIIVSREKDMGVTSRDYPEVLDRV